MCYYDHAVAMRLKLDPWSGESGESGVCFGSSDKSIRPHRQPVVKPAVGKPVFAMLVVAIVCVSALAAVSPWLV